MRLFIRSICGLLLWVSFSSARAEVSLPKILSDNMVLQRDTPVAVWGTASPAERVRVSFGGKQATVAADAAGAWRVHLGPFAASAEPRDLQVVGTNTLTLHNILVGEVWLCSGQSNMEYALGSNNEPVTTPEGDWAPPPPDPMHRPASMAADLAAANDSGLRVFKRLKALRSEERQGGWRVSNPRTLSDFSAVAYYFGERLRKELKVPVGLVETSWGGSRIEPWTPASAYSAVPAFAAETSAATASGLPIEIDGVRPGNYWESMVRPLVPYTVKGFLWYQGESNVMPPSGAGRYAAKMQALIASWRAAFADGTREPEALPFYYVQIPPLYYSRRAEYAQHPPEAFAELREQQTLAMAIPHTGMIVATDLADNLTDIHPKNKVDVADRLARWALSHDYGQKGLAYSGPVFRGMTVSGATATLSFDHAEGLASRDGAPLNCFTIAGADGRFVPAEAKIVTGGYGPAIAVSSVEVASPTAVRFSWGEVDQPNLVNGAGLPAIPFRTDGAPLPSGI